MFDTLFIQSQDNTSEDYRQSLTWFIKAEFTSVKLPGSSNMKIFDMAGGQVYIMQRSVAMR